MWIDLDVTALTGVAREDIISLPPPLLSFWHPPGSSEMSDFSLVHRITEIKDNTGEKLNVLEVSLTFYPFIILLKF